MELNEYIKKHLNKLEIENKDDIIQAITKDIEENYMKDYIENAEHQKEIDNLNNVIAENEKNNGNYASIKEKYDSKVKELDDYKKEIEKEKNNSIKLDSLKNKLLQEGASSKAINLLVKEIDLEKVEIDENNIVKNIDTHIKSIKENYNEFFTNKKVTSPKGATPPINPIDNTLFTREQIEKMTPKEINEKWDIVSKSLENIK